MLISKPFAFFFGLVDGLTGQAAIGENGLIQSAYTQKHQYLFQLYTARRMQALEEKLQPLRQKSEQLLFEHDLLRYELENFSLPPEAGRAPTVEEIRQRDKIHAEHLNLGRRIAAVTEELISISNQIRACKLQADEDLISLSDRWRAAFTSYCKGTFCLKRTPVLATMIPQIEYDSSVAYKRQIDDSFRHLLIQIEKAKKLEEKEDYRNAEKKEKIN